MSSIGQMLMEGAQEMGDILLGALELLCSRTTEWMGDFASGLLGIKKTPHNLSSISASPPVNPASICLQPPLIPAHVKEAVAGIRQHRGLGLGDINLGMNFDGVLTGIGGVAPSCQHFSTAKAAAAAGIFF